MSLQIPADHELLRPEPAEAVEVSADIYASRSAQEYARLQLSIGATVFELARLLNLNGASATELASTLTARASAIGLPAASTLCDSLGNVVESLITNVDEVPEVEIVATETPESSPAEQASKHVVELDSFRKQREGQRGPEPTTTRNTRLSKTGVGSDKSIRGTRRSELLTAPSKGLSDAEVLEMMVEGRGTEQKAETLIQMARSTERSLDSSEDYPTENESRTVVLVLRATNALRAIPDVRPPEGLTMHANRMLGLFVSRCERLIRSVVKDLEHPSGGLVLDDLCSEGRLGLMEALGRYDLARKEKVITFCVKRIHGAAVDAIRSTGGMIKASRTDMKRTKLLDEIVEERLQAGKEIDEGILAQEIGMSIKSFQEWRIRNQRMGGILSTDLEMSSPSDSDGLSILNLYPDEDEDTEGEALRIAGGNQSEIDRFIDILPERDRRVILMRFGYPPYDRVYTLNEIADELGVTESRPCQIIRAALEEMGRRLPDRMRKRMVDQGLDSDQIETSLQDELYALSPP